MYMFLISITLLLNQDWSYFQKAYHDSNIPLFLFLNPLSRNQFNVLNKRQATRNSVFYPFQVVLFTKSALFHRVIHFPFVNWGTHKFKVGMDARLLIRQQ